MEIRKKFEDGELTLAAIGRVDTITGARPAVKEVFDITCFSDIFTFE